MMQPAIIGEQKIDSLAGAVLKQLGKEIPGERLRLYQFVTDWRK